MKSFAFLSRVLLAAFLWVCVRGADSPLAAQTDIYIRGAGRLIPVAVPQLCTEGGGDVTPAREIPKIMGRDLDLSGYFEVLDPGGYIESPGKCGGAEAVVYSDWSVLGTEGLVRGIVTPAGPGMVRVQLFLHDVQGQRVVLGKEYEGDAGQIPMMAHRFANEVMKFFTGELGPFGSRVVFSGKVGRFKELFVMDIDGSNLRQISNERALALSASWDVSGQSVVYTSFRNRLPDLFIMNVAERNSRQITRGVAMELGAEFLTDGTLVLSRNEDRNTDIVQIDLQGKTLRTLTRPDGAINVSPSVSPDGQQIAFCSNRAGGPQIYTMPVSGGPAQRVSFVTSNYCTSPAWSPKGNKMAFVCRVEGRFQLFLSDVDGGNAVQLTSTGDNEDPSWSPDGRYLIFASSGVGKSGTFNLALLKVEGGGSIRQLTDSRSGYTQPAWGPRS